MFAKYAYRRLSLLCFMLFTLTIFTFALNYLFPGELITNFSGEVNSSYAQTQALVEKYRIEENIFVQYAAFMTRMFEGDWGLSLSSGQPVLSHVKHLFPATLELCLYALTVAVLIGVPSGVIASAYHKKWPDKLINSLSLMGFSIPVFWLALLLIMAFCLGLGLFPMSGRIGLLYEIQPVTHFILIDIYLEDFPYGGAAFWDALHHLALPTIVLAMYPTTVLIRFTRDSMLEVLDQNYIKTARAKGLNRSQLIIHHALRNALLPVIKQIGLQFSTLITLAMITEVIFSWPGIGRWLIESIYQRDFPAIQGGLLAVSFFVIIANMLSDFIHSILDPLARNQAHGKV
ncbi:MULTISPECIES: ABC transporter permease [unclassified Pseudoalteromonas]|uniref:ABC transporter permease n=1 Tax=unclassified Pseudoalteromonas TaxID=194690 RepID=UPI000C797AAC|nr:MULTISPECIES: ABC transporter permease subunit [unclassified Pseudoalteromonas]AUJ70575.1 Peptide transport system permease protein SapB [Pseudoalteromonas sp. NC201]MCF2825527.1 ABC transporter permease subunit [Pseudoalteromonas sp. OF5H-5]MCF2834358.1 ABC transporter permease subunit [Pseudoalteromonas sp. DL2-H6]MCF2923094.1 ABC transporter permease subunit [Pseudoalteromonas sp. DL2-H1]